MSKKINHFEDLTGFECLWDKFLDVLAPFGIDSVAYGCAFDLNITQTKKFQKHTFDSDECPTTDQTAVMSFVSGFIKTNYPQAYQNYFSQHFTSIDDYAAQHCLTERSILFWHHEHIWLHKVNEQQKKFIEKSCEFGMAVGVSIPIRFSKRGVGGFGLCSNLTSQEFDKMWQDHSVQLLDIVHSFHAATLSDPANNFYQLSAKQIELLKYYYIFGDKLQACEAVFPHVKKTEAYNKFKQIKQALDVQQDTHMLLKAQEFDLI